MAKTYVITDDIDGSPNAETVTFAFGGQGYEIDLSKKNRAALEKVLKPYIEASRKASTGGGRSRQLGGRSRRSSANGSKPSLSDVRAWAKEQGIQVSERGRVSSDVLEQYNSAH